MRVKRQWKSVTIPVHVATMINCHIFAARLLLTAVGAILLAGCQSPGERLMARAEREDACGATQLRGFVGREANQATRVVITRQIRGSRQLRWIVPGADELANLDTGRINIVLNDSGIITGMSCY